LTYYFVYRSHSTSMHHNGAIVHRIFEANGLDVLARPHSANFTLGLD
jgi:hypothetical protein